MMDQARASARQTAVTLIAQYGEDAEVVAVLRAAELAAMGDAAGLAVWDAIRAEIIALQSETGAPAGESLH